MPNFKRWSTKRLRQLAARIGMPGYEGMDRAELIMWHIEAWS